MKKQRQMYLSRSYHYYILSNKKPIIDVDKSHGNTPLYYVNAIGSDFTLDMCVEQFHKFTTIRLKPGQYVRVLVADPFTIVPQKKVARNPRYKNRTKS